jgi:RNA polymerase sigma-70 factor (ECF subfamily)
MELDRLTVERLRRGDRGAQDLFLRRYAPVMHAFVRRAGPGGDADDLCQELLGKLLSVVGRFTPDGPATLTTWVFTVAHRWLLDEKKRRHLQLAPMDDGLDVPDSALGPEAAVHGRQLDAALERALQKLPEAQRRVFVLTQVHEQPLETVAEVEGVPVGTLKSRLHRARGALAVMLQPVLSEAGNDRRVSP